MGEAQIRRPYRYRPSEGTSVWSLGGRLPLPSPEVIGAVGDRYGIEVVGPPIRIARGEGPA